jgi:hypothetical protein
MITEIELDQCVVIRLALEHIIIVLYSFYTEDKKCKHTLSCAVERSVDTATG